MDNVSNCQPASFYPCSKYDINDSDPPGTEQKKTTVTKDVTPNSTESSSIPVSTPAPMETPESESKESTDKGKSSAKGKFDGVIIFYYLVFPYFFKCF